MSEITINISTKDISGSIALTRDNTIFLDIELTEPLADTDVIKLYLNISGYPPLNCGTAEMRGGRFQLTKILDNTDIDSAHIVRKNVFTEQVFTLADVSFAQPCKDTEDTDEVFDMDEIRQKLSYLQDHPAYKAYLSVADDIKSPVEAAAEALDKLQEVLSRFNEEDDCKRYMNKISNTSKKYQAVYDMPPEFQWHRITDIDAFDDISSFEHILNTPCAINTIKTYGYYLLGFNFDKNIACIAVPVAKDAPNPISHVDDCTVYIHATDDLEYCTVCVAFEADGQYFMPIC